MSLEEMKRLLRSRDPSKISRIMDAQSWWFKLVSTLMSTVALCAALFLLAESQDEEPSNLALRVTVYGIVAVCTLATWAWVWRRAKVAEGSSKRP
jgi:uncharacterized membrane protein